MYAAVLLGHLKKIVGSSCCCWRQNLDLHIFLQSMLIFEWLFYLLFAGCWSPWWYSKDQTRNWCWILWWRPKLGTCRNHCEFMSNFEFSSPAPPLFPQGWQMLLKAIGALECQGFMVHSATMPSIKIRRTFLRICQVFFVLWVC
jgi:hypothetical protein